MSFLASTEKVYRKYLEAKKICPSLRLGQFFCNSYVKRFDQRTDPLFNQRSDMIAKIEIDKWMNDHQYYERLPPQLRPLEHEQ